MNFVLLLLAVPAQVAATLPDDSVRALRRSAEVAESRYERLSRSLAPFTWSGPGGGECDEIVGRFCLRFDSVSKPPAVDEAKDIGRARQDAVEAARRHFAAAAGDRHAAGPLIRLLVRDGRAREAAAAAGAFAALTADTLWGHLLNGFALHHSGEHDEAVREFDAALAFMNEAEREAWLDVDRLVSAQERRAIARLGEEAREEYRRRLWLLADPFWITPANERRAEHMARHVEARLLARVPAVAGALSWGRDQDELTVRYGTPTSAERMMTSGAAMGPAPLIEHWDTAQRAFLPETLLTEGYPEPPDPGAKPVLYAARARSAYALQAVPRVIEPTHQVSRFLDGSVIMLRVDGSFAADGRDGEPSAAPVVLVAFDTSLTVRAEQRGPVAWQGDSARFAVLLDAPPALGYYSVEVFDPQNGVGARARYALPGQFPAAGPIVSDILITQPLPPNALPDRPDDPVLRGRASLQLRRGDTVGIYAEVYRAPAGALRVELSLQPAGEPPLLARAARWIGRALTGAAPETDPRVEWSANGSGAAVPISLNLPLPANRRGLHELVLRVTAAAGGTAESRRLLRLE